MTMNEKLARSSACNGRLLSAERRSRGWTQSEFAAKSGFTERLIVKAEAGKSVSVQTLKVLAETLSEVGDPISMVDLASDAVDLARQFIFGMYQHGSEVIPKLKHLLAADVVFHFAGDPKVFPFSGTHVGIEATDQAFRTFFRYLEPPEDLSELDSYQFVAAGRGAFVWGESWIHPIGKPMKAPVKLAIKIECRDGKITLFDDRFDTQEGAKHFHTP